MPQVKPNFFAYNTPIGSVTLASDGQNLTQVAFGKQTLSGDNKPSEVTNRAANQLQEYFAGKRREFDLPLAFQGTEFQRKVWEALTTIPYGETRSYGEIAAKIGNERACRAVGSANNKNPLPIIVPCHRVIGATGKPVGYAGGLKIKEFLLNLEQTQHND